MKKKIVVRKPGKPCLWECGGGVSNTGSATIIANADGSPKQMFFLKTEGPLSCGNHALFVISVGDVVVQLCRHQGDYNVNIEKITVIDVEAQTAEFETIATFDNVEWDNEAIAKTFATAVEAAKEKSLCYNCTCPHYYTSR